MRDFLEIFETPVAILVIALVIALPVCILIASMFAFASGVTEADRTGTCGYHSVLDYFPTRALGCELAKKRW